MRPERKKVVKRKQSGVSTSVLRHTMEVAIDHLYIYNTKHVHCLITNIYCN